ncbi:MAG TPA: hypothetical protein VG603_09885 [Chitinophagales bacterium]|nr:hypothetical protein [Chitinophagales bacterium]
MKTAGIIFNVVFSIFLLICVGVHVYGLFSHFNSEPQYSHIIHIVSYGLCLYAYITTARFRLLAYVFGSIYPFLYHAHCAWVSFTDYGHLNGICILVVVMIPIGKLWLWKTSEPL